MNFLGLSGFLGGLLYYTCLFIVLVVIMVAGIYIGKKLRDRKDAKKVADKSIETEKETTVITQ